MGIWDGLRLTAGRLFNRSASSYPGDGDELGFSHKTGLTETFVQLGNAVRSNGAGKLKEYVPDVDRRVKISRIAKNLGKFAVESAIDESLKGVTGGIQVYKIVKDGLKDPSESQNSAVKKKPDLMLAMMEMHAKIDKMQEDMNNIKQQTCSATNNGSETKEEFPDEQPINSSGPPKAEPKRVFIRSRL